MKSETKSDSIAVFRGINSFSVEPLGATLTDLLNEFPGRKLIFYANFLLKKAESFFWIRSGIIEDLDKRQQSEKNNTHRPYRIFLRK